MELRNEGINELKKLFDPVLADDNGGVVILKTAASDNQCSILRDKFEEQYSIFKCPCCDTKLHMYIYSPKIQKVV